MKELIGATTKIDNKVPFIRKRHNYSGSIIQLCVDEWIMGLIGVVDLTPSSR